MQPPAYPDETTGRPDGIATVDPLLADALRLRGRLESAVEELSPGVGPQRTVYELAAHRLDDLGDRVGQARALLSPVAAGDQAHGRARAAATPDQAGRAGLGEWNLVTDAVHWSAELFRIFGRNPAQGALTLDQLPAHLLPEDQLLVQGMITSSLVDGKALDGRFRIVRADGAVRTLYCVGEPVTGPDGHVMALWMVVHDLGGRQGGAPAGSGAAHPDPPAVEPVRAPDAEAVLDIALRRSAADPAAADAAGWCDLLRLSGGGALVTLGGTVAADGGVAAPAMLRDALRGMAMSGAGPARMLDWLCELLPHYGTGAPLSALCCRYEPGPRPALLWTGAGHPAPLLYRGGAARLLSPLQGEALISRRRSQQQQRLPLQPGDALLCWTGGPDPAEAWGPLHGLAPRISTARSAAECADLVFGVLEPDPSPRRSDRCVVAVRVG